MERRRLRRVRELVFSLLRHLSAFLALPFMATVLIPAYLLRGAARSGLHAGPVVHLGLYTAGFLFGAVGLALFVSSVRHFASHGRGTLAPWDPPKVLVVTGPYRFEVATVGSGMGDYGHIVEGQVPFSV